MTDPHPIRKRMKRWEIPGDIRFVTFSCERRLPLLGHPSIRDLWVMRMASARRAHAFQLYAWVVMPEHIHLLLRPSPTAPLDRILRSIKLSVAKRVIGRWRQLDAPVLHRIRLADGSPRFWQKGGGFDRNVRGIPEFCRHVRYIHRNPVKRGLVVKAEDWQWSSVRWWMGALQECPCDPPPGPPGSWDRWKGYV